MAINNFIPTVWSEALYQTLQDSYVAASHCNRDFEGVIREKGDVVKVCGINNVTVRDYKKNSNMQSAEELKDFFQTLSIDHAKYFNFQIDDIDRAQGSPRLMELAMKNAAAALANEADCAIFKLHGHATERVVCDSIDETTVLDAFLNARSRLYTNKVSNSDDIVIEVSPQIAELIVKAKMTTIPFNDTLETGCIGNIAGCKVFVSSNVATEDIEGNVTHFCTMRTKRSIAFAEQLSEIQAYRPELRFADAVKGLYLFGTDIIYPNEYVSVELTFNNPI